MIKKSTIIPTTDNQLPSWATNSTLQALVGGLGGAALGRFILAPVVNKIVGGDIKKQKNRFTVLGGLTGVAPAIMTAIINSKMQANPYPHLNKPDIKPTAFAKISTDSMTYDPAMWRPTFGVARAMDDISNNPYPNIMERVKMRQLIAESGKQEGVGLTGLASPASLWSAASNMAGTVLPAAGAAWVAAKALAAPDWLKNTGIGAAVIYSSLNSLLGKSAKANNTLLKIVVGSND